MNLLTFKKREPDVREDVVSALEDLLAKAKSGEVTGIYFAVLLAEGSISTGFSHHDEIVRALGAVEILKRRMVESVE